MLDFPNNKFLIDYLTFSSKVDDLHSLCSLLHLDFSLFSPLPYGLYGYQERFYYQGITLLCGGHSVDMGVCCQMSGSGCRTFESYSDLSWCDLLFNLYSDSAYNVSRLDVAYDDFDGIFNIDTILESVDLQLYRSPSRSWTLEYGSEGTCIYIGSPKSDFLIRIYDKARERGYDIGEKHWIRLEMQLRNDRAFCFICNLYENVDFNISRVFLGVLSRYLVFVDAVNDTNKSRWPISSWWSSFLADSSKIRLCSSVGVEYNDEKLYTYLHSQPAGAIKTYVRIYGLQAIESLVGDISLSPKYLDLLKRKGVIK